MSARRLIIIVLFHGTSALLCSWLLPALTWVWVGAGIGGVAWDVGRQVAERRALARQLELAMVEQRARMLGAAYHNEDRDR